MDQPERTKALGAMRMTDGIGVMICGHGSRDENAVAEFSALAGKLRDRLSDYDVESGFLEFARPIIRDGLDRLRDRGAARILAMPAMLFAAGHVKNDLPWEINSFAAQHPGLDVRYGRELGIDPRLLAAAAQRIEEGEAAGRPGIARSDSLLLVVGRGTNDSDANSNVAKVARMLGEGMGFGWTATAFSGVAHPRVDEALDRCRRLGFARIVVFPYFLFTGILVKRIYAQAEAARQAGAEVEILTAPYLNDHPLVLDSFVERIGEMLDGDPAMNCRLCKYRDQIIGYEDAVGAAQAGHHHHVRGIGTDHDHHHGHGHDHAHGHDHDHRHGHSHGHGHAHSHD
jgi:sirohydrochlorin cobaltochelatase